MSKLILAADKLREIWDDYKDKNIYGHMFYPYGYAHELPDWMKYVGWPPLRKMLRYSCAETKRPFIFYENYPYNEHQGVTKILYLPRNKKNFGLASNLLLVARQRERRYGGGHAPIEVVSNTAKHIFYFTKAEGAEMFDAWMDTFLNDDDWRFNAGLPKRVRTGE